MAHMLLTSSIRGGVALYGAENLAERDEPGVGNNIKNLSTHSKYHKTVEQLR